MKRIIMLVLFGLLSASAAVAQDSVNVDSSQPIRLNVANVATTVSYQSPSDKEHIETMLPFSLEQDVRKWVTDNIIAAGQDNSLRVDITEASVTESHYDGERVFFGMFSGPKMTKYHMTLSADIKAYSGGDILPKADVQVKAEQSGTIESNDSIANHEKLLKQLSEKIMSDFARQTGDVINANMSDFISK